MKIKEVNNMKRELAILLGVLVVGIALVGMAGANIFNTAPQDWSTLSTKGTMEVRLGSPGIAGPTFGWVPFSSYRAMPLTSSRPFITGVRTSWSWRR